MSNDLVVQARVPIPVQQLEFTEEDLRILTQFVVTGAHAAAVAVLVRTAAFLGLNPFLKEVQLVKFDGEHWSLAVGKHGYTKLIQRNPAFGGWGPIQVTVKNKEGKYEKLRPDAYIPGEHRLVSMTGSLIAIVPGHFNPDGTPTINPTGGVLEEKGVVHYDEYVVQKKDGGANARWTKAPFTQLEGCLQRKLARLFDPGTFGNLVCLDDLDESTIEAVVTASATMPDNAAPANVSESPQTEQPAPARRRGRPPKQSPPPIPLDIPPASPPTETELADAALKAQRQASGRLLQERLAVLGVAVVDCADFIQDTMERKFQVRSIHDLVADQIEAFNVFVQDELEQFLEEGGFLLAATVPEPPGEKG
jgi:hypothetical protein